MAQKASKSLSPRGRFWHKQVQQWQRSGTTQVQYCQEHKLSIAAFRVRPDLHGDPHPPRF
jgi:hypothetical protein